jgi:hypothetical protein
LPGRVQSLLEDAGIEYEVLNTARQYVTNSQLGYAEFWVAEDRAEEARAVLADLSGYDDVPGQE